MKRLLAGIGLLFLAILFARLTVPPAASVVDAGVDRADGLVEKHQVQPRAPEAWLQEERAAKIERRRRGYAKMDGPDVFAEYHRMIRTRIGEERPAYRLDYRMAALRASVGAGKGAGQVDAVWIERGPGNVSGRTRAVAVDSLADASGDTWFAGSVSGGIWKTTDAGRSWRNLTPDLPNLATASLAQSASDPAVLYAGTGEGFFSFGSVNGDGIWKSTDRGETWTQLASTAANPRFHDVNRLIVDPADADVVVAATNKGIFRTEDGGQTWTQALKAPGSGGSHGALQQVVAHPQHFDVQYAAANSVGVYKSSDAGRTWTKVWDATEAQGKRLELAVAPSAPERLYASVEGPGESYLYTSGDAGLTWTALTADEPIPTNWLGGQGWYDNAIAVHPFDPSVVFVGGVDLWRLDVNFDTGERLASPITDVYGEQHNLPYVHPDHHYLHALPLDRAARTFRLYNSNDGGVAYSDTEGRRWTRTDNGYNTTQFYGVDKRPGADQYLGGMQDNSTWHSPPFVEAEAGTPWMEVFGGDGFSAVWHAEDDRKMIGSSQYNLIVRSLDGGETWGLATDGIDDGVFQGAPFFTTITATRSDPDLLFTTGPSGVWRSDDFAEHWTLAAFEDRDKWANSGHRIPVAVSLADPQVVWAGARMSSTFVPHVSTDGGLTFRPVQPHPGVSAHITNIATHPTQPGTAYLLFANAGEAKVLRTNDFGATWEPLSGTFGSGGAVSSNGFPDVAVYSLLSMPHAPDELWAGTEIGLFRSTDDGASWHRLEGGLPAVSIWEMKVVDDQVVFATHGRGVWTATLPALAGYRPPVVTRAPRLGSAAMGPTGALSVHVTQRSAYDSTAVALDGTVFAVFGPNAAPRDTLLSFPIDVPEPRDVSLSVVAYRDGRPYASAPRMASLFAAEAVLDRFTTDFETNDGGFRGEGLSPDFWTGFDDYALHSAHPYRDRQPLTYQLSAPIRVAAQDAVLRYRDVALIEPGDPGSVFGDFEFWDYVVVEGSRDGVDWRPLADGYDAGYDPAWAAAYESGTPGSAELFVQHEVDLHDTFAPGDVIFIRFRLFADAYVTGWGWAIDDLEIQPNAPVATESSAVPGGFELAQNYPNPFNPTTTIPFTVGTPGPVQLDVYDLQGRRVATLVDRVYAAGRHQVTFDAGLLPSGLYFYRLEGPGTRLQRSMTLVK